MLNLKIRINLAFFSPQERHDAPIKVKFGMLEYVMGLLLRAKLAAICEWVGTEATQIHNLVKFAVFLESRPE